MPRVEFIMAKESDIPKIREQGGIPAEVYFCKDTGKLYVVEKDSLVEFSDFDLKTEEGQGNFDSKSLVEEQASDLYKLMQEIEQPSITFFQTEKKDLWTRQSGEQKEDYRNFDI